MSYTTTPQLTRLRPSVGNDLPWTLVPTPTSAEGHRLAMFPTGARIAAIPSIWLGWLPRNSRRSIPDTADHLEKTAALPLTVCITLLSTNVGDPTAPFSRLPWPEPSRLYQITNGTSRPAFLFTHQRTHAAADFSVFPNHNKPTVYRSRPRSLATPQLTGSKPPTALQPSSTTQPRTTFPTTVHRRSRVDASAYTAFFISILVRYHGVLFLSGLCFFLRYVSSFSNHRPILFLLPVNTEQFPSNPTTPNPHPSPKTRLRHHPFCRDNPVLVYHLNLGNPYPFLKARL